MKIRIYKEGRKLQLKRPTYTSRKNKAGYGTIWEIEGDHKYKSITVSCVTDNADLTPGFLLRCRRNAGKLNKLYDYMSQTQRRCKNEKYIN